MRLFFMIFREFSRNLIMQRFLVILIACSSAVVAEVSQSRRFYLQARASTLDPKVRAHPEIGFLLEKDGKAQDVQHACVDTRCPRKASSSSG